MVPAEKEDKKITIRYITENQLKELHAAVHSVTWPRGYMSSMNWMLIRIIKAFLRMNKRERQGFLRDTIDEDEIRKWW
jgi:hypothetical protein